MTEAALHGRHPRWLLRTRFVFEHNKDFLPKDKVDEYNRLRDPATKQRGKEKLVNGIINACVPRGATYKSSPMVKENIVFKMMRKTEAKTDSSLNHGMDKLVMIGTRFGASKALFQEAVDAGQCWLGKDGKYHVNDSLQQQDKKLEKEDHGQTSTEAPPLPSSSSCHPFPVSFARERWTMPACSHGSAPWRRSLGPSMTPGWSPTAAPLLAPLARLQGV